MSSTLLQYLKNNIVYAIVLAACIIGIISVLVCILVIKLKRESKTIIKEISQDKNKDTTDNNKQ
jgi:hypothetical protein